MPASPNAFRFTLDPLAMEGLDLVHATDEGMLLYPELPFSLSSSIDSPGLYSPASYNPNSLLDSIDQHGASSSASLTDDFEFTKRPAGSWTVAPSRLSASLAMSAPADVQPSHVQPSQVFAADLKTHTEDLTAVDFGSVFDNQLDMYDSMLGPSPIPQQTTHQQQQIQSQYGSQPSPVVVPQERKPTPKQQKFVEPPQPALHSSSKLPTPSSSLPSPPAPASAPAMAASPTCTNCNTQNTPLWRRDPQGQPLCNACGLFLKLHGVVRPLSLKTNVIKKRNRGSVSSSAASGSSGSGSGSTTPGGSGSGRRRGSAVDPAARDAVRKSKSRRNSVSKTGRSSAIPTPVSMSPA